MNNLSLIAAVADNGVIGNKNDLPWKIKDDMAWFKQHTMSRTIVAGRKTHESILTRTKGKPLPGRKTIVLTRDLQFQAPGCIIRNNWGEILRYAENNSEELFVIGGEEIYRLAMPNATRLYLTRVHAHPEGDAFFPKYDPNEWHLSMQESHEESDVNQYPFTFEIWQRKST